VQPPILHDDSIREADEDHRPELDAPAGWSDALELSLMRPCDPHPMLAGRPGFALDPGEIASRIPKRLSSAWCDRQLASSADLKGSGRRGVGDRFDPQAGPASDWRAFDSGGVRRVTARRTREQPVIRASPFERRTRYWTRRVTSGPASGDEGNLDRQRYWPTPGAAVPVSPTAWPFRCLQRPELQLPHRPAVEVVPSPGQALRPSPSCASSRAGATGWACMGAGPGPWADVRPLNGCSRAGGGGWGPRPGFRCQLRCRR
jgi:hypothetical protein